MCSFFLKYMIRNGTEHSPSHLLLLLYSVDWMLGLGEKRILLKICHAYHVVLFGYTVPEGWLHACSAEEEGIKVNPIELSQFVDFIKCDKLQTESFVIGTNQCKCFLWVQCAITIPNICLLNWRIGRRGMILLSVIKEFEVVLYGSTENWKVVMNFDSKVFNIWTLCVFLLLTVCAFFHYKKLGVYENRKPMTEMKRKNVIE